MNEKKRDRNQKYKIKKPKKPKKKMAIDFKPFDELFEPVYQLTYISLYGDIDVGPNTYNVFHAYTMQERQVIYQVCQKYLQWQITEVQEEWERTMYMYQFIIKSPPPFPYSQYLLNEDITMAISWDVKISNVNLTSNRGTVTAIRTDDQSALAPRVHTLNNTPLETVDDRLLVLNTIKEWDESYVTYSNTVIAFIDTLEQTGKTELENWELVR